MRYAAALLLALALAAVAFWGWRDHPPAPVCEPPLDLPPGGSKLTLVQRHDANVPGSNQRLRVHIGDITRAQVELTLVHRDGRQLILVTSVSEGDSLGFSLGGQRYHLGIEKLKNLIIGDDFAVLEFVKGYSERGRIEHLLAAMRKSGLTFFRNRTKHDGARAAAHLRRKWNAVRDRIETAEQFIEHLATRSSMTGRPYGVRLEDGRVVEMRVWLTEQLDALDAPRQG